MHPFPHLELIWERINSILGVPPEPDHDQRTYFNPPPSITPARDDPLTDDVSPGYLSAEPLLAVSILPSFSLFSNLGTSR